MAIEDLKRWHWCVIGCVVGAAVGSISLAMLPREIPGTETIGPLVFEGHVRDNVDPSARRGPSIAGVRNVSIHPPSPIPVPGERAIATEYISYEVLVPIPENPKKGEWRPRQMILELRKPHDKSLAGKIDGLTMRQYLDKVNAALAALDKARYPRAATFPYKFNWIETPRGAYPAYTIGGLVVIGLVWPTIVQLLVGAGFGRAKHPKDEYDVSRYKGNKAQAAKAKAGVTQDQMDQLDQLEAELEAKLKSGEAAIPTPAKSHPVKAPIPVLSAGPLEAPKESSQSAQQRKGYGADQGDFYPTEVHVHGKKSS